MQAEEWNSIVLTLISCYMWYVEWIEIYAHVFLTYVQTA